MCNRAYTDAAIYQGVCPRIQQKGAIAVTIASAFAPIIIMRIIVRLLRHKLLSHVAIQPRVVYKISVLFCNSEYSYQIRNQSRVDNLPDSPWFYEDMQNMIDEAGKGIW